MNVVLQCLGALRVLIRSQQEHRVSFECSSIDTYPENHRVKSYLKADIFSAAVKVMMKEALSGTYMTEIGLYLV